MATDAEYRWYLTFISIVFGVFISLWVQPFFELVSALSPIQGRSVLDFSTWLSSLFRGIAMFFF